ncbi:MAG TPA: aminopeptidase N [Acetobacteraceae bacterium]|nr:aminopeptidase N [Acetobacteraceae bacterium]
MDNQAPAPVRRLDYRPPDFLVDAVELIFELDPAQTVVRAKLEMRRNPAGAAGAPLRLDGEALRLRTISLDGRLLDASGYALDDHGLEIASVPDRFRLQIVTELAPAENTELSGLYTSGGGFFTQCEAQGFRRITFFPDRPDVMARYTTTLIADRAACPVLLSNGNPDATGEEPGGRHWARWVDPHPKPSYLFALVAGDLIAVRDHFRTASGRDVALAIWVRDGDQDKCAHAMASLKRAMTWDEERFGLEYDLDVFNIAAVSDFNMGAMENKGLNVFNTKYVLAKPETATDADYQDIESVVAHEYFHNWTGDRVTCRDWFQLSLKEGLTVYRDQEFSADQGSRAVKRLRDVRRLRAGQFAEDDGPLAHPVRPDAYLKIDNFYTATVYSKGAEVVRMIETRIGRGGFRAGLALYIARHDNQAVTIEDFVAAMADASGVDLADMLAWYSQAGTPALTSDESYDAASRRYTLTLRQATKPTPGQPEKQPLPIPVALGLLDPQGGALPARLAGEAQAAAETRVVIARGAESRFVFEDVAAPPVPSLLRGFSAPVRLAGVPPERLRFLARHDSDPFVRWDSGQQYATDVLLDLAARWRAGASMTLDPGLRDAVAATLMQASDDPEFAAEALALPGEDALADAMEVADTEAVHAAREFARAAIGRALAPSLRDAYAQNDDPGPYAIDGASIGRRALKNVALGYLAAAGDEGIALARTQFDAQRNMTDVLAALAVLARSDDDDARAAALASFHARWQSEPLVIDKWFAIQATAPRPDTLAAVQALTAHPDFDLRQPNRVRALIGAFASGNPSCFHAASGAGYDFLAAQIIALDPLNSQVAARLVSPLGRWQRQDAARQALMRAALARVLGAPGLSGNVYEMVSRSLG